MAPGVALLLLVHVAVVGGGFCGGALVVGLSWWPESVEVGITAGSFHDGALMWYFRCGCKPESFWSVHRRQ